MEDLKILWAYFKEHQTGAGVILIATIVGAV